MSSVGFFNFCLHFLRLKRRFAGGRHRLILFTDDTKVDIEQAHNAQNDRQWSVERPALEERVVSRQQGPKSVMVWAGVGHGVKSPLFFLPEGVKQNGQLYREFLRTKVFPWARRTYGHYGQWQRHWVFMQDGAPSHKAEETQNFIRDNVPDFIEVDISPQRNNGMWPPNSPDLNVLDYTIWSILKADACSKPHQSIDALKKSLVAAWNRIPQEVIDRAVDAFPKKLQKCIAAGGGHFENE